MYFVKSSLPPSFKGENINSAKDLSLVASYQSSSWRSQISACVNIHIAAMKTSFIPSLCHLIILLSITLAVYFPFSIHLSPFLILMYHSQWPRKTSKIRKNRLRNVAKIDFFFFGFCQSIFFLRFEAFFEIII